MMNFGTHSASGFTSELERQVRQAQAEMVFDRSRSSNLMSIPVSLLICSVLWTVTSHELLLVWLAAKVSVTLWRVWLTRRFDADRPERVLHWERLFIAALAADGFVFGLLGTWLLPRQEPILAMAMVATLLGIAAVALVVLSMSIRASLALTVPVLLPALLWQLTQADRVSLYAGTGMAVFLGLVLVEGRRASLHTAAMLRLQFGSGELAQQRQQALAAAERSNAVKSRFLATMSHEMRTPLHGILGLARLQRADGVGETPTVRAERLQTLERTGEHLLGLINDVLDYSRIESGHLRLQRETFDLAALVRSVATLAQVTAAEKGLTLRLDQQLPEPCPVWGAPARLRQVLLNLLGNAVKFTERGQVELRCRPLGGDRWRIDVIDTGCGIPAPDRERIFSAFEQLDGSFARRHGGTGLGLTISRELVQAMGGELRCDEAPSGGAHFWLEFPAQAAPALQAPAARAPAPATPAPGGDQARVLLAEDNPVNALVAQAVLQRMGLDVTTVTDGAQAVDEATREPLPYRLVLMDCQMPGLDGFEATARIRQFEARQHRQRLPIVALTANALEGDRERSMQSGMDAHLAKPFRDEDLQTLVTRHLAR